MGKKMKKSVKKKKVVKIEIAILCVVLLVAGILFVKTDSEDMPAGLAKVKDLIVSDDDNDKTGESEELSEDAGNSGEEGNSGNSTGGNVDDSENMMVQGVELPYKIGGTELVIERLTSYEGVFIEDGSDVEVTNVATILVRNSGSQAVEYADITFVHNGRELKFKVTDLPAGASAAVQELNKEPYEEGTHGVCYASAATLEEFEKSPDVKVTENTDGSLTVENVSKKDIPCVRIFYKFYMEDEDAYVGGITYTAKVTDLKAGDMQIIMPSHYVMGSSKIMMVRTYDSAE